MSTFIEQEATEELYEIALDISGDEVREHVFNVDIQHALNNMNKKQDYVCSGNAICETTGLPFQWTALFDGHGTNKVIDYIRKLDMNFYAAKQTPAEAIQAALIKDDVLLYHDVPSGSTMLLVKVFHDHAETISVGDSQIMVFEDGQLSYMSTCHDSENVADVQRLKELNPFVRQETSQTLHVLSETRITAKKAGQFVYSANMTLAPTQVLGHRNRTGLAPETHTVVFQPGKRYRITGGSDGVFDMAMLEHESDVTMLSRGLAEEIVGFYTNRWLQKWDYMFTADDPKPVQTFSYVPSQADDVSAFTVDIV
jgi:serine/threonine protein phosphatase PrpC